MPGAVHFGTVRQELHQLLLRACATGGALMILSNVCLDNNERVLAMELH